MRGRKKKPGPPSRQELEAKVDSPFLNRREAAAYLRVSLATLQNWKNAGLLPFARLGKARVLFRREDLDAFVNQRMERPSRKRK